MVVEAPIRNIAFTLPNRAERAISEENQMTRRGFWEYGPIAGRPESSEGYWVPVDWMAWKLLVEVLEVPPEKLK